jgi:hypothetical protein
LDWYRRVGYGCLIAAVFCAASVGMPALLVVLAGTGNYFFYSMPPLRLKRVPLASKLLIR